MYKAPEIIRQVHIDYFYAGADIAITTSYQASIEGFTRLGLDHKESLKMLQRSVSLEIEARDIFWKEPNNRIGRSKPLVAASIDPYGAYLADSSEYIGKYGLNEKELMDFHHLRMATLIESGPDILACETLPCFIEAHALVKLLSEFPNTNAWISFSAKDEIHICHGEKLAECVT